MCGTSSRLSATLWRSTVSEKLRRLFDVFASFGGLLLLSPLFALVALAIKLDTSGPIFFRAERAGKDGKLFRLYKFRSMVADAQRLGPRITSSGDPRVTRVGRWLRRTKIDELPQLINVLKGEMSLVGPRPEDPKYVSSYTPEQRRVLRVKPGITSVASVMYKDEETLLTGEDWEEKYRRDILPHKLSLELDYLQKRTFISDISIIFGTLVSLFKTKKDIEQ